jgi:parvulin-like peptidyl-prolyl isomerase
MKAFLVLMVISVFGGLGVSFFGGLQRQGGRAGSASNQTYAPILDPKLADTALTVNDRKVTNAQFNDKLATIEQMMQQQRSNPQVQLSAYGYAARAIVQEEVLLGEAQRLGAKAGAADIKAERDKILEQIAKPAEDAKSTGNAIGDLTQKLGSQREKKADFEKYLSRAGLTAEQWQIEATRTVLQTKAREAMQKELDSAKDAKAKETQALIDEQLAKGVSFADLATKYSEAEGGSAQMGGDMKEWLKPGLLPDTKNDDTLFATKTGEMTPWFEVDAGYQRWQVYDRKDPSGPAFEAEKPKIIEQIKSDKGDSYTPSDEEVANKYRGVKARQIMLKKTDPEGLQKKIEDMVAAAKVEINNPYALAFQALYDEKIQPPAAMDYNWLVDQAKTKTAATADYDFSLVQAKLDRGKPQAGADSKAEAGAADSKDQSASAPKDVKSPEAGTADAAKADGAAADGAKLDEKQPADAAAADKTAAAKPEDAAADATKTDSATTDKPEAKKADANPGAPCYAVAVALLKVALEDSGKDQRRGAFGEEIVAVIYLDWLNNEAEVKNQPVDRDKARQEVETLLAKAIVSDNYNGELLAARGTNLAWLDKPKEADEQLQLALKYVPSSDNATLDKIKATYDKLEMPDKSKLVQDKIDKARQEALKAQIDRAIAQQQAQQQSGGQPGGAAPPSGSVPITIPPTPLQPSPPPAGGK